MEEDKSPDAPASTDKSSKVVAESFREHHEEIRRRSEHVQSSDAKESDTFERVKTDTELPLVMEEQAFVLYSVSHVNMSPISEVASEPAIRFYGAFATEQDALDHARHVQTLDASCNLQMSRTHAWNLAAKSPERVADDQGCRDHIAKLLAAHEATLDAHTAEFTQNVAKRQGGESEPDVERNERTRKTKEAEAAAALTKPSATAAGQPLRRAARLPRGAEARDQAYVVVSFIPDTIQTIPEFAWKVYACFNDMTMCDVYIRNTLSPLVKTYDIDVCVIGEWLHPQNVIREKLRSEVWRSPELGNIMQQHKSQPAKVDAFKKWREGEGSAAPGSCSTIEGSGSDQVSASEALGIEKIVHPQEMRMRGAEVEPTPMEVEPTPTEVEPTPTAETTNGTEGT